jgi:hypothetical protein
VALGTLPLRPLRECSVYLQLGDVVGVAARRRPQ